MFNKLLNSICLCCAQSTKTVKYNSSVDSNKLYKDLAIITNYWDNAFDYCFFKIIILFYDGSGYSGNN